MTDLFYERMLRGEAPLPMHQHTNHLPVHPEIIKRMEEFISPQEWTHYGDPTGSKIVKDMIADELNIDRDKYTILLTNGAIEAIYMIMQHFHEEWDSFTDCFPSWPWPRNFISAYGVPINKIEFRKMIPDDITPDSLVNILNGQHPLSLHYTDQEMIDIAERAEEIGAWIMHDMTYRDFFPEYPTLLEQNPDRTFVTFSFSKANNFAGLRIGGLICSNELAKRFNPLNPARLGINVIAEQAAIVSLETKHLWKQQNIDAVAKNNRYIYDNLKQLEDAGKLTMPKKDVMSDVWIDLYGVTSKWVAAELLKMGVRVNDAVDCYYDTPGERWGNANHLCVTTSVPDYWVEYFCKQMNTLLG